MIWLDAFKFKEKEKYMKQNFRKFVENNWICIIYTNILYKFI